MYRLNLEEATFEERNSILLKDQDTGKELLSSLVSEAGNQSVSMISDIYFIADPPTLRCIKPEKKG